MNRIFCLLVALLLAPAASTSAFDLTGTWEGKWSCKGLDLGIKSKLQNGGSVVEIVQTGDSLAIRFDDADDYGGITVEDVSNADKGAAAIVACSTSSDLTFGTDFDDMQHWRIKTNPASGKGRIKGVGVWSPPGNSVSTCKYSYKRVSTTPPVAVGCP